ncbi:MAG: hypothetical protein EHM21_10090 [Chloroflexi bacterium]|nr:MAG: hypothetical protein EHM21_10090 [Chloroflexota bacterium]
MSPIHKYLFLLVILLLSTLTPACAPLLAPVRTSGEAPTPIVRSETAPTDGAGEASPGNGFVELAPFQAALLQAIQSRDKAKLEPLMAENFASGWWRGEMGDLARADALRELYQDQLGDEIKLGVAPGVDLPLLMGGTNPLDIPRPEVNVVDAIVVTGWGKDGKDEAILFVSRQPDNALRWAGTLVVKGGFTSPETGGVEPFVNKENGYQLYLPKGFEVQQSLPNHISILAPRGTQGHRERAFITVEPANGRTVEQIVAELKATALADVAGQPGTVMGLDSEMALIFDRVPSQEFMRMLYVVHEDRLYTMIFIPQDETQGAAYNQMRNLFAVVANTFKFIPVERAGPAQPSGGKLVADPGVFTNLLQQGLTERDKVALQSMMGDSFALAFWRSEGMQIAPGEAIQQILNNYVPAGAQPVLDRNHRVIASLFSEPLTTQAGEELIPVHVTGWGAEGKDEAVLFIARRADGSLYWQGALTAPGGFEQ